MTLTLATGIRSPPLTLPPLWIGQNHGGLNLAFGDGPIFPQEPIFLLRTNRLKAALFVKLDCPNRIRPSPDQHGGAGQSAQVRQQLCSNSSLLAAGANVGMPD